MFQDQEADLLFALVDDQVTDLADLGTGRSVTFLPRMSSPGEAMTCGESESLVRMGMGSVPMRSSWSVSQGSGMPSLALLPECPTWDRLRITRQDVRRGLLQTRSRVLLGGERGGGGPGAVLPPGGGLAGLRLPALRPGPCFLSTRIRGLEPVFPSIRGSGILSSGGLGGAQMPQRGRHPPNGRRPFPRALAAYCRRAELPGAKPPPLVVAPKRSARPPRPRDTGPQPALRRRRAKGGGVTFARPPPVSGRREGYAVKLFTAARMPSANRSGTSTRSLRCRGRP